MFKDEGFDVIPTTIRNGAWLLAFFAARLLLNAFVISRSSVRLRRVAPIFSAADKVIK
jgi:hypothetical protein